MCQCWQFPGVARLEAPFGGGYPDMRLLTQADLDKAAHQLNGRPRQTLGWMTPSDKLAETMQ